MEENALATLAGWISILCWIVVFTPQIYENYRNKTGESLSLWFLGIWLIGDVFNIIGVVLEHLLLTMLLLAIYYALADIILIYQVFYYRRQRDDPENDFLLKEQQLATLEACCFETTPVAYGVPLAIIFIVVSGFLIESIGFSQYTGWCSAVLYIGSRIPQILKNWREKCMDGLSLAMFLFGIAGNGFYCASIFLQSTQVDYIMKNLPWLVGSGGTLLFDVIIGLQFFVYKKEKADADGFDG